MFPRYITKRFNQTDEYILEVLKQTKILTEKIHCENSYNLQNDWINVDTIRIDQMDSTIYIELQTNVKSQYYYFDFNTDSAYINIDMELIGKHY